MPKVHTKLNFHVARVIDETPTMLFDVAEVSIQIENSIENLCEKLFVLNIEKSSSVKNNVSIDFRYRKTKAIVKKFPCIFSVLALFSRKSMC